MTQTIYLVYFALVDLVVYALLNNKTWLSLKFIRIFFTVFAVITLIHSISGYHKVLMPASTYFALFFFSISPVILHIFFKYRVLKMLEKQLKNGTSKTFLKLGRQMFFIFFLRIFPVMGYIVQVGFILSPTCWDR